jgi:hypothetical protein
MIHGLPATLRINPSNINLNLTTFTVLAIVYFCTSLIDVSYNPIDSFKLFLTIINTIVITLTLFIFTLRRQHDTYIIVTVPMKIYDKCVTENVIHLRLSCRDRRNMSVWTEKNNGQKRAKGQTSIYKTLHSKLKNKTKPGVNSGAPEG